MRHPDLGRQHHRVRLPHLVRHPHIVSQSHLVRQPNLVRKPLLGRLPHLVMLPQLVTLPQLVRLSQLVRLNHLVTKPYLGLQLHLTSISQHGSQPWQAPLFIFTSLHSKVIKGVPHSWLDSSTGLPAIISMSAFMLIR